MALVAAALKLSCFAYLALPRARQCLQPDLDIFPSWTVIHLQRGYDSVDPVVRRAMRQPKPFRSGPGFEVRKSAEA